MIEFHLDSRSGVSPYLQIVQQVRQALRLGLLREGDQLPTVKEVVGQLAINPNTVLKAYRELEHEGLASARPGVGTFVTGSTRGRVARRAGPAPPGAAALDRQGATGRARRREHRGAVPRFLSFRCRGGHSVSWVLDAQGLGKRYGRRWALSDCDLQIPSGHVVGLVGPNGAGKTTLLHLAVGLLAPTAGTHRSARTVHRQPTRRSWPASASWRRTRRPTPASAVEDHLRFGAQMNPGWDDALARRRIGELDLDLDQRAGSLSGGQRAQLALTLAVAKRPELLVLDEPVASLDPLARREFLQSLMEFVADGGVSVVLSSHLVADLERVCDYLVVLVDSRVQVAGEVDELLAVAPPPRRPAA